MCSSSTNISDAHRVEDKRSEPLPENPMCAIDK